MNCKDTQHLIAGYIDGDLEPQRAAEFHTHLAACPACQANLRIEQLLRRRLRALEAPLPRAGYAQRVLSGARGAQRVRRSRAQIVSYALAASLAVAVAVGWLLWQRPASGPTPSQVVTVQGNAVQPVRLVFNSPTALTGVTMRVGLPEGVELAEYPGMRELTWKADLKSGSNMLELPVVVHGRGGVLVASVSYGTEQRQFTVLVQASSPSSYGPQGTELRHG